MLCGPYGQIHPLQRANQLQVVAQMGSGKPGGWRIIGTSCNVYHKFEKVGSSWLGSISNNQLTWRKWAGWYCEQDFDHFESFVNEVLSFLAFVYEKGCEYTSINRHRSVIPAYHLHVNNNPNEQHPRVCVLITGTFNNSPPMPNLLMCRIKKKYKITCYQLILICQLSYFFKSLLGYLL